MHMPQGPNKNERPSTYFVPDREKREELVRLTIQGHMLTRAMGGPLPEQTAPERLGHVLDVACGPGDWARDLALKYPNVSVIGIDISQLMIDHANEEARKAGLQDRVSFYVMDALGTLTFPDQAFGLVNMRLGVGFLRTWDWPRLLHEFLRVTRSGGILRLTDMVNWETNSQALTRFSEMGTGVPFRAGHLFTQETGLAPHLAPLLKYHGWQQVQTRAYDLEFRAGTPEGQACYEDLKHSQTARPFYQKWGYSNNEFDQVYSQALKDEQESDFWVIWHMLTSWGSKP